MELVKQHLEKDLAGERSTRQSSAGTYLSEQEKPQEREFSDLRIRSYT
jgi:hypothetical protein